MVKIYVSPRPIILDSFAMGGLITAKTMTPAVDRVARRETLSKYDVA